ncbi:MAG TPA: zf-HC2 domain-containing protein [bacterium]|jgi:anti-sigma factor RsiW|nr:zf-HC2 domain-containing protein [bacterium]
MSAHAGEQLSEWIDGHLNPDAAAQVAAHVDVCDRCRQEVDDLRRVRTLLRRVEAPSLRPAFWARLEAHVAKERERLARRQIWRRALLPAAVAAGALGFAFLPAGKVPLNLDSYLHEHAQYRALHPLTDSAVATLVGTDASLRVLRDSLGRHEAEP